MEYKCELCDFLTKTKSNLKSHVDYIHNKIMKKCEYCDKVYGSNANMKKHVLQYHTNDTNENIVKCDQCGKKLNDKRYLKDHISIVHEGKRDHMCSICGKAFYSIFTLNKHISNIHDGRKRFKCDFEGCEDSFDDHKSRTKHKETVHKDDKYKFYCEKCHKGFNKERGLKEHLDVHREQETSEVPVCHICGFNAKNITGMKAHMRFSHSEEISDDVTFHFDPSSEWKDVQNGLRRSSKVWGYFLFNKDKFSKCRICGFATKNLNYKGHSGKL